MKPSEFMKNVNVTHNCWLWLGSTSSQGYGQLWNGKKNLRAHRIAYELFVSNIPEGLLVCHKCDVRNCVNPGHLFVGAQKDNAIDMASKKRHAQQQKTHCPAGHEYSQNNLILEGPRKTYRRCKTCRNEKQNVRWRANGRKRSSRRN